MMGGKCMKSKKPSDSDLDDHRVLYSTEGCTLLSVRQYGTEDINTSIKSHQDSASKKSDFDSGFAFDEDIPSFPSVKGSLSSNIWNKLSLRSSKSVEKEDSVSKKSDFDSGFAFDEDIQSFSSVKGSLSSSIRNKLSGIQLYERSKKEDSTSKKHIPRVGVYKKGKRQKRKITEIEFMEEKRKDNEFLVLSDLNYLPRFKYHRSLVHWFMESLQHNPAVHNCYYEDCSIIIGGEFNEESKLQVFEGALLETIQATDLPKDAKLQTEVLVVYFFTGDEVLMHKEIRKLGTLHTYEIGIILFVVKRDKFNDEPLRRKLIKEMNTNGITQVEFVIDDRTEVINKLSCVLEKRLSIYLKQIQEKITLTAGPGLFEVNAILRRLKQATCYPYDLTEDDEENESEEKEISKILQRFGECVTYHEFDGDILHVVTNDQGIKERIEAEFLESGIKNLQLVITVAEHLSISELSRTGIPLHGAKFVFVNEGVDAFHASQCFATTGSLMFTANNNRMVAVTCRHALERVDTCFTLIDNVVVTLGREVPQSNNNMERLTDDIALVLIEETTCSIVNETCEKLLIDAFGLPSPSKISHRNLKVGDIVHKRGANTKLTTGIVKHIETKRHDRFVLPSTVIYIAGIDSNPFADSGDSGSLVFEHSLSPEENSLNVLAMVQGKLTIPNSGDRVICFPIKKGWETLKNNIPELQDLQFYQK